MSIQDDAVVLWKLNITELVVLAHSQGLGQLRRDLPKETLISIVGGYAKVEPEHLAMSNYTREKLEDFIQTNYMRVRNQLPGCNGRCTSFTCTEGKHALCYQPNSTGAHE